ncbi:hypothetical protein DBR43_09655 [Pedobacter sp. KBW06]|uniref:hypothetical protein n=1 Tax=Pedobacter sp. KBW06 TaxID=2153359 RepID=UPI000F59EE7E|nr:hypothetical protein [Pedobacter sp. KBW06]RQO75592.1 hypothetical protein DBR43_09655 [Pedobacter sp. KBW06]
MKWPKLTGDIGIASPNQTYLLFAEQKLQVPMCNTGISIEILMWARDLFPENGLIGNPSNLSFYISKKFMEFHSQKQSTEFGVFMENLETLFAVFVGYFSSQDSIRSAVFSIYYLDEHENTLLFQLSDNSLENWMDSVREAFVAIHEWTSGTNQVLVNSLKACYVSKQKIYYLSYEDDKWNVVDPLAEVTGELNQRYKENNDPRARKPDILLYQDDFSKKHIFSDDWVLKFDDRSVLMIRPNDVSIYAKICDRNLKEAQVFFDEYILDRNEYNHHTFPTMDKQKKYLDYFELITTALIFSFTALEAFINMMVAKGHPYLAKNGKRITKKATEEYNLSDKLKILLKDILSTPDPQQAVWWEDFRKLLKLRNQTIHTKESVSEKRYSKLLEKDTYRLIGVYKDIISYYGYYVKLNAPDLLDVFPYDFGYDQVNPRLIDEQEYERIYKFLHNPS